MYDGWYVPGAPEEADGILVGMKLRRADADGDGIDDDDSDDDKDNSEDDDDDTASDDGLWRCCCCCGLLCVHTRVNQSIDRSIAPLAGASDAAFADPAPRR